MEKKCRYTQKHNAYTQQYIRDNYKQLSIRLPKVGDITREAIQTAADAAGLSVNAYIVQAVREKMSNDLSSGQSDK